MSDADFEKMIDNEKEWRRVMWKKLDKVETELVSLRIKNAGIASLIGAVSGLLASYFKG